MNKDLIEFIQKLLAYKPACNCHEAYTSRNLDDPGCQYHATGWEEIDELCQQLSSCQVPGTCNL